VLRFFIILSIGLQLNQFRASRSPPLLIDRLVQKSLTLLVMNTESLEIMLEVT
jgi:hypothetical protein